VTVSYWDDEQNDVVQPPDELGEVGAERVVCHRPEP
jgi:hypothetical protein